VLAHHPSSSSCTAERAPPGAHTRLPAPTQPTPSSCTPCLLAMLSRGACGSSGSILFRHDGGAWGKMYGHAEAPTGNPGKQASAEWLEFSVAGGALHALAQEQAGELCGPRPPIPAQRLPRMRSFGSSDELSAREESAPQVWQAAGPSSVTPQGDTSGWERARHNPHSPSSRHCPAGSSAADVEALRWEAAALGARTPHESPGNAHRYTLLSPAVGAPSCRAQQHACCGQASC
jgi:hypothetical protein